MKKYLKLNANDKHLSWGNFTRTIKEFAVNKTSALQIEIFCTIFNIDNIGETTVNNYCVGIRSINNEYKQIFINYQKKYKQNKNNLLNIIINLLSIIDGHLYAFSNDKDRLKAINQNKRLKDIITKLYNISKNDKDVKNKTINKIKAYLQSNNLYEALWEILFFIVLEKKQPIYEEDLKTKVIENILNATNISTSDLEEFLNLQFMEGINYNFLLKKMAEDNNPFACFKMGMDEYKGLVLGFPRYEMSYEYFAKAAKANMPNAYYMIGRMYLNGLIGTKSQKDLETAYKYLKKAVDLGSITAINTLGILYLNGIHPIKKDLNKAFECFQEASKYNYAYAYNNLAHMYELEKNYAKAFECFLKSADLGESWACNKVGECYRTGTYTKKDLNKAFKYYNNAINIDLRSCSFYAYYNLAKYFYLNGCQDIVKIANYDKAIEYFKIASKGGIIEATKELLYIYTDKYLQNKDETILNRINKLANIIEKSPSYDEPLRQEIENTLRKIKTHQKINLNIILD